MPSYDYWCELCDKTVTVEHPESGPYDRHSEGARRYPESVVAGFNGRNATIRCATCPFGPDMDRADQKRRLVT